jgi:hypothetical protein
MFSGGGAPVVLDSVFKEPRKREEEVSGGSFINRVGGIPPSREAQRLQRLGANQSVGLSNKIQPPPVNGGSFKGGMVASPSIKMPKSLGKKSEKRNNIRLVF